MSLVKLLYFGYSLLRWIRKSGHVVAYRRHLLLFLSVSVLLIISSYTIDYYCLQRLRPNAFHLPFGDQGLAGELLTFFYFSVGRFTTAGGSEVYPLGGVAQALVVCETLLAYFTTVIILANLGLLQALLSTPPPPDAAPPRG